MTAGSDVARAVAAALPAGSVATDPAVVAGFVHDEAAWAPHGRPAAVVRPRTTAEVARVVAICAASGTPLVTRGAGTGLSGGANAIDGCVVLSTARMTEIVAIDPADRLAVVRPGVVNDDLRARAARYRLWYPPDPASSPWSTIGGNVATNAGGLCCVKYGSTRDYVAAVEAVVGAGDVVRLGGRTTKNSAGYDLRGLLIGSEGTLGVITEVTLRLRRAPRSAPVTVVGLFGSLAAAGDAVAALTAAGVVPAMLELMDQHAVRAVEQYRRMDLDVTAAAMLLCRLDTGGPAGDVEAQAVLAAFEDAGATTCVRSDDAETAEALFAARRMVYPALKRLGAPLTEDVCVPTSAVARMLALIGDIATEHRIAIPTVAHAGDGNLHPVMILPNGDGTARRRAHRAFDAIVDAAIELGGTVTGEHGVGLLKRDGLTRQLDPAVLDMHRAVKAALDPAGIFNPGKVFDRAPT